MAGAPNKSRKVGPGAVRKGRFQVWLKSWLDGDQQKDRQPMRFLPQEPPTLITLCGWGHAIRHTSDELATLGAWRHGRRYSHRRSRLVLLVPPCRKIGSGRSWKALMEKVGGSRSEASRTSRSSGDDQSAFGPAAGAAQKEYARIFLFGASIGQLCVISVDCYLCTRAL